MSDKRYASIRVLELDQIKEKGYLFYSGRVINKISGNEYGTCVVVRKEDIRKIIRDLAKDTGEEERKILGDVLKNMKEREEKDSDK